MAARLKARVAMVTRVGNDVFGPMTRENFGRQGSTPEFVISDEQLASGVAPIMVDDDGHNMVIIIPVPTTISPAKMCSALVTRLSIASL